ncbi:spindle assembly abnormal protein 6 homolog isoform X2 [Phycodurus eques]|uniref:spindle assembly abnormal protein 6 homolog isoform X2 n=1 Tax=Phycodurus eques TaxID=693459 RepID=UPI002ACD6F72|nr:spindle assembly abnormal protein 6 homolog isoform X2 [Phycodurus eques]
MVGLAAKSAKMEKMFSKVVQVTVRCRDCDERKAHTRVAIELQASKSGVHKRDLVVRLTDDTDPYFLFNLTLCQEDFQSLKVQQGLLIEFTSFPEKLIELLHRCQSEQSSSHPRFQLLLSCDSASLDGPAHLSVMETNSFKHINHLSLRLDPGSDKLVKDYLAVCLSSLKAEKEALEVKLQKSQDDLIRQLNYAQQALSEKSQELEHQRSEWTLQSSTLSSRHADELRSEREKTAELQNRLQQQTQQLRQDLESAHQRSSRQMQSRLAELETSCGELTDRKYKNEAVLRDLESKLAGVEEECQRAKQQAASLRRENGSLDAALRDKERLANRLQTRVAVLEQKVKDEEALVSRTEEALKATRQQKESVQENAQSKEVQLRNLEAQGKILSEDVKKGNEIIRKFQCELQVQLDKLKMRDLALLAQEKELERAQNEARDAHQRLGAKDEQVAYNRDAVDATRVFVSVCLVAMFVSLCVCVFCAPTSLCVFVCVCVVTIYIYFFCARADVCVNVYVCVWLFLCVFLCLCAHASVFVCVCVCQIVELKEKLESSVQKLTETKGVLQKNENVISRLNKQLNEKQLSGKFAAPSENTLAAALTSAGPRQAHFYPHATIAAVTPDIIHKHAMSDSAGLDAKYFKRRDDAVPVYALPDALVPRECPPQRTKAPVASAYFTD